MVKAVYCYRMFGVEIEFHPYSFLYVAYPITENVKDAAPAPGSTMT